MEHRQLVDLVYFSLLNLLLDIRKDVSLLAIPAIRLLWSLAVTIMRPGLLENAVFCRERRGMIILRLFCTGRLLVYREYIIEAVLDRGLLRRERLVVESKSFRWTEHHMRVGLRIHLVVIVLIVCYFGLLMLVGPLLNPRCECIVRAHHHT